MGFEGNPVLRRSVVVAAAVAIAISVPLAGYGAQPALADANSPSLTAAFTVSNIPVNATTTLTFTLTNHDDGGAAPANAAFTVALPAGLAATTMLQIQGSDDDGYAMWTPSGLPRSAVALLATMPNDYLMAITLHELVLSRHIHEAADPGGLLDHGVDIRIKSYPAQDVAMLAATGCM